jgi:DNA-binding NarL/FixJ family response regulator
VGKATHSIIEVCVTEPLEIARAGLRALIDGEADLVVVADAGEATELVQVVARLHPAVLIFDPRLPGQSPAHLLAELQMSQPRLRALVLADPQDLAVATLLLDHGATGCFLKSDHPSELLRGIRAVATGELAVSGAVTRFLLRRQAAQGPPRPLESLTDREQEVFDLLQNGLTNREIAQQLYLSIRTVEVHLRNVYAKLGVRSRLEAVTKAAHAEPSERVPRSS